ncbi:MAG: hypothetical protein N3A38_03980 [Planctomycetota bacterium]|nr:hypothetical protein [Planctomycetota bacterium]
MEELIALIIRLISEALGSDSRKPGGDEEDAAGSPSKPPGQVTEWDRRYRERAMRAAARREQTEGPRDFRSALEELERRRAGRAGPVIAAPSSGPQGPVATTVTVEETPRESAVPAPVAEMMEAVPEVQVAPAGVEWDVPPVQAALAAGHGAEAARRRRKRDRRAAAIPSASAKDVSMPASQPPAARADAAASFIREILSDPSSARRAVVLAEVLGRRGGIAMRGRAF